MSLRAAEQNPIVFVGGRFGEIRHLGKLYCSGLPVVKHELALPFAEKRTTPDSSLQNARVPEPGSAGVAVTLYLDDGVPPHPVSAKTYPFFLPLASRGSISIACRSVGAAPLPMPPNSDSVQVKPAGGKLAA
jgi:hypothetical protein